MGHPLQHVACRILACNASVQTVLAGGKNPFRPVSQLWQASRRHRNRPLSLSGTLGPILWTPNV
jgi:hypothetical protein